MEDAMERWKRIYDGVYEVSNLGKVRRITRASGTQEGKLLNPKQSVSGRGRKKYVYLKVALSHEGVIKQPFVHTLVAEAFLGPKPKGMFVNHKDGDTFNNSWRNLEYVTARDNALHASSLGLLVHGEDHAGAKVTEEDVREIRRLVDTGVTYREISGRYGINQSTIHAIVHRRTWKHIN